VSLIDLYAEDDMIN